MFPVSLQLSSLPIAVVGKGACFTRRVAQLEAQGAHNLTLFTDEALPIHADMLQGFRVVFVTGLSEKTSEAIAALARHHSCLLHVEDVPHLCDFHISSFLQRGDLSIGINTSGKSPALGIELKKALSGLFSSEWGDYLDNIGKKRDVWRKNGDSMAVVVQKSRDFIQSQGWLEQIWTDR